MYKVFVDSDVIISSLISSSGASYFSLHDKNIVSYISSISLKELKLVIKRLDIDNKRLERLIKESLKIIPLKNSLSIIKNKYKDYIFDIDDAHIIAGAAAAKTNFLISYNKKHFKLDKIKEELKIIVFTPGEFLQYLRSL